MPSKTANDAKAAALSCHTVVFVVMPGVKLLDLAGPLQVFTDTLPGKRGTPFYRCIVTSMQGGQVPSDTGVGIDTVAFGQLDTSQIDTLLVVGGNGALDLVGDAGHAAALSRLCDQAGRIGSICTGAFLLAELGLLDDRPAATHWKLCDRLKTRFPKLQVDPQPIFTRDNKVWTSAGVTAGIDLALAMVAEDLGWAAALYVARDLVTFMVRPGCQTQFSTPLQLQHADKDSMFAGLLTWMQQNLHTRITVEDMAHHANMSSRNFHRQFTRQFGMTPAKALQAMRLSAAQAMLEDTDLRISTIALRCGFGGEEAMRRAFQKKFLASPSDYRERFGSVRRSQQRESVLACG